MSLIIAVVGCGPGRDRFVGHWQGRAPIANPAEVPADMRTTAERVNLILRADGSYDMVWMGLPIEGRWSGSAEVVVLEPNRVMERTLDRLGEGMSQFGKTLRLKADGADLITPDMAPGPTRFKRIKD